MKRTVLARRLLAGAASAALGLGGVALTSTPVQAEDRVMQDTGRYLVDCQTVAITAQSPDPVVWRVFFEPDDKVNYSPVILWQSGDWPADADLTGDVPAEWTSTHLDVEVPIEGLPDGWVTAEYWDSTVGEWVEVKESAKKREYSTPCGRVPQPEVTEGDCETAATITLPERDPQDTSSDQPISYTINGESYEAGVHELEPGTYEVVVVRPGGQKDYTKTFVFEVPEVECEDGGEGGELPETGTTTALIAGGAVVLLALGAGVYLIARRRRVTFTA